MKSFLESNLEALLKDKEILESCPHEEITVPSWYPNWPEGGTWSKMYILSNLNYMILQLQLENTYEYMALNRAYGHLIHEAVKVVKREKVGN